MTLNNFEPLVEVLLHGLVIDQVLFELFGEFGAQNLQIFDLFRRFSSNFDYLVIDVLRQEVGSLGRILLRILHVFQDFGNRAILSLLDRTDFVHDVFEQILHEHFRVLIRRQPLIDLNLDHFGQFVCDLQLCLFEGVDLVANRVVDFGNFTANGHFLLGPRQFFLSDPRVDPSNLSLQICRHRLDRLVFSLELLSHI